MEGLRGLAVFLVFLVHYNSLVSPYISEPIVTIARFVSDFGHLGVDLFFVLSGYLIYGNLIQKSNFDARSYCIRRVSRIYPTFIFVFLLYLLLSIIFPYESKIPSDWSEAVSYVMANLFLLPGIFEIKPVIAVAWSLSYEVFYYITIPILIYVFGLQRRSVKMRLAGVIIVSVFCFLSHYYMGGKVRLLMFVSGIALFELFDSKRIRVSYNGEAFFIILLGLFGASGFYEIKGTILYLIAFVGFIFFCLPAFNPESKTYSRLSYKPLRWLGNMSYSYYLIHGLTLKFLFLITGLLLPSGFVSNSLFFILVLPFFIATLISSFILFIVVERPLSLNRGR